MIEKGERPGEEDPLPRNILKESFRSNGKNIIVAMLGIPVSSFSEYPGT